MDQKLEITEHSSDEVLVLRLKGRIDAFWTNYLETKIEDEIREGNIRISLKELKERGRGKTSLKTVCRPRNPSGDRSFDSWRKSAAS